MKKCWIVGALLLLLSGCGAQPVMETVADGAEIPVVAQPQRILLQLPEDAQSPAVQTEGNALYECDGFTVCTYTMPAGNMDETLRSVTGYEKSQLYVIGSYAPEGECYQCAWTAAGEGEMQLGSAKLISDGNYHYVVSVLAPESSAAGSAEVIRAVLDSFSLESVNTGT